MRPARPARRRFLKQGATLAGLAMAARPVGAQTLGEGRLPGDPGDIMAYGERSRFVTTKRTTISQVGHIDMHGDPKGLDARTPIGELSGIITPSDLHYVSQHSNAPEDIDPSVHRLMIYGMVERPLIFTMDELKRLPFVSRIHYIECIANRPSRRDKTLEDVAGMVACSEWTGVPLSVLLDEAGVDDRASWILAEGADRISLGTSIPLAKCMDDTIVAYAQNGEPVRPQNGFPLRLVVPGFEGKYHVKWLNRIKVSDKPYATYWEQSHFTNYPSGGLGAGKYLEQGPKSVITFPAAGGHRLPGKGFYNVSGLAWSGCGAVKRVEVSTDGGQSWGGSTVNGPAGRANGTVRLTSPSQDAVTSAHTVNDRARSIR